MIDDCRANGAYDPTTMGTVPNVGLMAQKAEEYGSHDKTFEIADGRHRARRRRGGRGADRARGRRPATSGAPARPRTSPIRDWVKLAVNRARATGTPAVFWLDENRAHDAQPHREGQRSTCPSTTPTASTSGSSRPPRRPRCSVERIRRGEDTISVTGNVLRDYLTDLFPILELGTSAKMLSIVPLLAGGGLFETGAGGSAPKHVQQLVEENYLRWDSLGEFLALAASLRALRRRRTTTRRPACSARHARPRHRHVPLENKSPGRALGTIDNRGSHFYLALYWAEELATQTDDADLAAAFAPLAATLRENEQKIVDELIAVQGSPVDIGGYYKVDEAKTDAIMRPSTTFAEALASL